MVNTVRTRIKEREDKEKQMRKEQTSLAKAAKQKIDINKLQLDLTKKLILNQPDFI